MEVLLDLAIKYWVPVLFGALSGLVAVLWKQFKAYKKGLVALLRNSIVKNYNDYIEREYIPIHAMEALTATYESYHALGGNGTITKLYEELQELPSHKPSKSTDEEESCNSCLKMLKDKGLDKTL